MIDRKPKVHVPVIPTRYDRATDTRVPSIDLNTAERYGELFPMTPHDTVVTPENVQSLIECVKDRVAEFDPEDYLLLCGDALLMSAALTYAVDQHGTIKVLRWDRRRKAYDVMEVTL